VRTARREVGGDEVALGQHELGGHLRIGKGASERLVTLPKRLVREEPVVAGEIALDDPSRCHRCLFTVTLKLEVATFALVSSALQVTVVVRPTLKRLPEPGLHFTGTGPSTSSCAFGA
jgi:hypothetical protein